MVAIKQIVFLPGDAGAPSAGRFGAGVINGGKNMARIGIGDGNLGVDLARDFRYVQRYRDLLGRVVVTQLDRGRNFTLAARSGRCRCRSIDYR
jgi:hypothetical protein